MFFFVSGKLPEQMIIWRTAFLSSLPPEEIKDMRIFSSQPNTLYLHRPAFSFGDDPEDEARAVIELLDF